MFERLNIVILIVNFIYTFTYICLEEESRISYFLESIETQDMRPGKYVFSIWEMILPF